jgi:glycosyltransferase involved in cell wall biosynthesis
MVTDPAYRTVWYGCSNPVGPPAGGQRGAADAAVMPKIDSYLASRRPGPLIWPGSVRIPRQTSRATQESVLKLSILMPVYNEEARLAQAVKAALDVDYPCAVELVIVDDGSRDGTREILGRLDDNRVRVILHEQNQGKGAAIQTAVANASGDYLVILDADLEYDPNDIPRLLVPVLTGRAVTVYGNRTFGSHSSFSFWYVMGNRAVTTAANVLYNCYLGDIETCFKLMPVELYRALQVSSRGFGMEAEVTGKLLRNGYRPYEVGISYHARTREEGKKITWQDGVEALWILLRERLRRPDASLPRLQPATGDR